jgi:hypothetical protein
MLRRLLPDAQKAPLPFDISTEEFLPLNVGSIAKRLNLSAKGSERGKKNLPQETTTLPDDVELSIQNEIGTIATQAQSTLANHFATFRTRLSSLLVDDLADRIRSSSEQTKIKMVGDVRNGSNLLFAAKRNVFLAENSLEIFRNDNKIKRPSKYPSGHLPHIATILLLFVIETIANAAFLAEANQLGLIGGVIEMFAISFINGMLGIFVGFFLFRGLHWVGFFRRFLMGLILLVSVAASLGFNLFVGHYRDVLASLAADPTNVGLINLGQLAVNQFVNSPLELHDFKSWIMSIIGVILSAIVSYKAYTFDDPYPGYGATDRHYKLIHTEYGRRFERLQQLLSGISKTGIAELDRLYDQAKGYSQEHAEIGSRVRALQQKLRSYGVNLEQSAQELLQMYRHANRAQRSEPTPKTFETAFKLDPELLKPPAFEAPKPLDLRSLNATVTASRKAVEKQHATLLNVYRTIDQLTAEQARTFDPVGLLDQAVAAPFQHDSDQTQPVLID